MEDQLGSKNRLAVFKQKFFFSSDLNIWVADLHTKRTSKFLPGLMLFLSYQRSPSCVGVRHYCSDI